MIIGETIERLREIEENALFGSFLHIKIFTDGSGEIGVEDEVLGFFDNDKEMEVSLYAITRTAKYFSIEEEKCIGKQEKEPVPSCIEPDQSKYKYRVDIKPYSDGKFDVYSILRAYDVSDPAIQHAIKKLLRANIKGHKDFETNVREAIESLETLLDK